MVKTLTITNEAYELLKRMKGKEDSFSKVIIKITTDKKVDISRFFGVLVGRNVEKARKEIKELREALSGDMKKRANVSA